MSFSNKLSNKAAYNIIYIYTADPYLDVNQGNRDIYFTISLTTILKCFSKTLVHNVIPGNFHSEQDNMYMFFYIFVIFKLEK